MVKITSEQIEFSSTNIQKSVFPYIGTILLWGGDAINTNIDGYILCNGQDLNIIDYPELYNVIGTTYGGSGTVFKVPNFKKRFPLGVDNSTNMSYKSTVTGGVKQLTNAHYPHTHNFSFNEALRFCAFSVLKSKELIMEFCEFHSNPMAINIKIIFFIA
jgi:microcystin-dependent protein